MVKAALEGGASMEEAVQMAQQLQEATAAAAAASATAVTHAASGPTAVAAAAASEVVRAALAEGATPEEAARLAAAMVKILKSIIFNRYLFSSFCYEFVIQTNLFPSFNIRLNPEAFHPSPPPRRRRRRRR